MDNFIYDNKISFKLNLVCFSSLNNKIKINSDPIPYLFKQFSEIESLYDMNNLTQILYFNINTIHKILYDFDKIIQITEKMGNSLSFNYYLSLLINAEGDIINYEFSINYLKLVNKNKKSNENKFFNLINSKINIDLINNFKNINSYEENEMGELITDMENENKEDIKNNIYILNEIKLNLTEDDIYDKNVEELYVEIIIGLIENNKLCDFEYTYNIFKQLDLENIDIQFLASEKLLNKIKETMNINNEYIKNNIINNFDDFNDINKINFHYLLLKFIFKSSIYIYIIPLLFQEHNNIIKILKLKEYITFTLTNQIFIERIVFIIKKLCNLDYYYEKLYLNKIKKNVEDNITNIKSSILKKSKIIFDISINKKINPEVNNIECIYDDEKKISYDAMLKYQEKNSEYENKTILNINFNLFLNYLSSCKYIIENQINNFQFNYDFKLYIESKKNLLKNNDYIYSINVEYKIKEHPFYKIDVGAIDKNILLKKYKELNGLISLMKKLNFDFDLENNKLDKTSLKTAFLSPKKLDIIYTSLNDIEKMFTSNIIEEFDYEEIHYQILKFEKIIFKHEKSIKFFLVLKSGYYLSCGNDKMMVLFNQDFNILKKINNLDDILFNITEINDKEKSIELFTSYRKAIYIMIINKLNYKIEKKQYEVPNMKILLCLKINENDYVLGGINGGIKVNDLLKFENNENKKHKLINISIKNGLVINEQYIALISNELIPKGDNILAICDLYQNKVKYLITDYSFNLSENSLSLIKFKDNSIFLICACKKYKTNQSNGILVVNMNFIKGENVKYKYYETFNFVPYCCCQIYMTIYLLIGGFNLKKRQGEIRLYKINNRNINELIYVQNIEIIDDELKNFYGINMPINNIIQIKDSGKIIVTTIDGYVLLFNKPNLDFFIKKHKT